MSDAAAHRSDASGKLQSHPPVAKPSAWSQIERATFVVIRRGCHQWRLRYAAKQGLTRRQLLVRSASTVALAGLGGLAKPYLSRAADRPRIACGIAVGRCIRTAPRWCGREPTGPRACGWNARRSKASRPFFEPRRRTRCRIMTSPQSCCSKDFRPGRIFSTGCGLKISATAAYRAKRRSGISGPRRRTSVRFRLSGPAIPRARAGASIPPAAACAPTGPCWKTVRISSSIPAITSTPIVLCPLS